MSGPVLSSGGQLIGREREREVLDRLLDGGRGGRGGVLVVHGEPGVGKTALLEYAVEAARGFRVARTSGVEAEMELPYAAVQQLCSPFLELMERLPQPQREALGVAFGLSAGPAPNPFLVGLAVLGLLSEAAEERPLLALSMTRNGWTARRRARSHSWLAACWRRGSRWCSRARVSGRRSPVCRRFRLALGSSRCADTAGVGLAGSARRARAGADRRRDAREPARPVGAAARAERRDSSRAGSACRRRCLCPRASRRASRGGWQELPDDARRLLLVAAADPVGDPALVWRAAQQLGIPESAAETVEAEGLLELGGRVVFRHPLVRSAVYRAARLNERRDVHRALAEATDPEIDPDRRAWHRAQAASMPDEDVAAELERSAGRAQARGGLAAVAAFLERAAALTPESAHRAQRLLAAAGAKRDAGDLEAALGLLVDVEAGALDELGRARVDLLRAQIALEQRRGGDAGRLFLSAASRLEPLDPELARETYLEALGGAMASDVEVVGGAPAVAAAARAAPPGTVPPRTVDVLLDAFAIRLTDGYAAAAPTLARALELLLATDVSNEDVGRWLSLSSGRNSNIVALEMWDDEALHLLASRQVQVARDTGALVHLHFALSFLARSQMLAGELTAASADDRRSPLDR